MKRSGILWVLVAGVVLSSAQIVSAACSPPACTKIVDNGPDSQKLIMAVLGDGFASAEQTPWNTIVEDLILKGVFARDFFNEQHNAFNVYRLNLSSAESGITTRTYDLKGTPNDKTDDTFTQVNKNTALGYIYSGSWQYCWMQSGPNTDTLLANALSANSITPDLTVIILNTSSGGGCGGGGRQVFTKGVSWTTAAHEFGHGVGGLRDEYTHSSRTTLDFPGDPYNNRNCSTTLSKANVFWSRFIDSATIVPTTFGGAMDSGRTVGEFEGCHTYGKKIYRPVNNCRMRGNTPNYCPVCQTIMRSEQYSHLQHDFDSTYAGDFDGDGKDDVLVKNGKDIAIYRASESPHHLDHVWTANNSVPSAPGSTYSWNMASGDKLYVADFDGDGKDDVIVLNTSSWSDGRYLGLWKSDGTGLGVVRWYRDSVPGYGNLGKHDTLRIADFDGDSKQDAFLWTGSSWSSQYLGMLKSTGTALQGVKRYDGTLPNFAMKSGDSIRVADVDGDGKQEIYVFNGGDWVMPYLGMYKSTGTELQYIKRFDGTLPGWQMTPGDRVYVADFDNDQKDDVYVFNGSNWCCAYLLMAKSTGSGLSFVKRYDDGNNDANNIPGWQMRKGDLFYVSDANKDGKKDLFVFNKKTNWSTEYLGTLSSSGTALSGSWSEDWVNGIAGQGGWNLGGVDTIIPVNYEGGAGKADIIIRNTHWLGMLRRKSGGFVMDRHYHDWIYTPIFDAKPWSTTLP